MVSEPARALTMAPVPPQNLDAEESVLGAMMLSAAAIAAVTESTTLKAADFYRESHGRVFVAILSIYAKGEPVDAITVVDELDRNSHLEDAGGADRIHELASIVPAAANAAHYARIVVDMATLRALIRAGNDIARLGFDRPGDSDTLVNKAQGILERLAEHGTTSDLKPLWLEQALTEEIPETSEYVEGVLEAGVLFDIVGLPYLHKSAAALELAVKVAKGRGLFLGKYAIKAQAKVAYFWADDSRPQELKRIQAYAAANQLAGRNAEVAFYLNPGISLPDDLPAVRRQIREHGYRMVIFDSLYNFADFDFVKDTGAVKHLYTQLKRLCDEVEGLTIGLVDHASKPSDSNRDRDDSISSYGAVWKAAAVRCSIVVTKKGSSLFVSATGNNVKGFPRTPAYFNQERLELALAEENHVDPAREQRIDDAVLDYICRMPGRSTNQIQQAVKGRNADIKAAIVRLEAEEMIADTYKNTLLEEQETSSQPFGTTPDERTNFKKDSSSQPPGTRKVKTAWIPLNKAKKPRPDDRGTTPDEPLPDHGSFPTESSSQTSSLYVVEGGVGTNPQESPGTQTDNHQPPPIDEGQAPEPEPPALPDWA
jgi:hypothetical protein